MSTVKIKMNTWQRRGNRDTKFKRNLAPREGYIELCPTTKKLFLKPGDYKCKPWDISLSRKEDQSYINYRKELYSGLCFESKKQAQEFMKNHTHELELIAKQNPLFDHWSIMNVMKRFEPNKKTIYGRDIHD